MAAPVLLPAGLQSFAGRFFATERLLLALAHHEHAIVGNPKAEEVLLGCIGAAVAERKVVLACTARVAVSFNRDTSRRRCFIGCLFRKRPTSAAALS